MRAYCDLSEEQSFFDSHVKSEVVTCMHGQIIGSKKECQMPAGYILAPTDLKVLAMEVNFHIRPSNAHQAMGRM